MNETNETITQIKDTTGNPAPLGTTRSFITPTLQYSDTPLLQALIA